MRIAIWHNLPSGGGKRALFHQVKGLLERGHTIESWCPPSASQDYLPLSSLVKENIVPLREGVYLPGLRTHHLIRAIKDHALWCVKEIEKKHFDVLFANSCMYVRSAPIGHYTKLPRLLYLQEPSRWLYEAIPHSPWAALPGPEGFFSPRYYLKFVKNSLEVQGLRLHVREEVKNARAFDRILCNSLFSRESILRSYGLESSYCPLGIDTDLFRPLPELPKEFIIGLGGMHYGKGIDRAIRAVGALPKRIRLPLLWIGNISNAQYLKEMVALAKKESVELLTKKLVSDMELVELLNRAALMIYPPRLEPFGLAPLEANACGVPVVGIAEGGVRETILDGVNGLLISEDDPKALARSMRRLLDNDDLRIQMGRRARLHVTENWSWNQAIESLESHLKAISMKTSGRPPTLPRRKLATKIDEPRVY